VGVVLTRVEWMAGFLILIRYCLGRGCDERSCMVDLIERFGYRVMESSSLGHSFAYFNLYTLHCNTV
jgi:hypothetical protein